MSPRDTLKHYFGEDALDWFDRSYIFDWIVVAFIWLLSFQISAMPVFERDFSIQDPTINHPLRKNQSVILNMVSSPLNQVIASLAPIAVVTTVSFIKKSLMGIHHGIIGLLAARGLARLVTNFLKHRIGRLRPDFLARCKWDGEIAACTGELSTVLEGRKSFPSGHSSTAFSGMFFLSLFISGQTAAWCFHVPQEPSRLSASRMARLLITLIPITWATHVALTRMEDYRHHKEDVIVGSLIGIFTAWICYLIFWPSPFSFANFDPRVSSSRQPRLLYLNGRATSHMEFELTAMDDNVTNAV